MLSFIQNYRTEALLLALLHTRRRRLMPLPLPLNELTRIALATAAMTAAVVVFPGAYTTLGLFQSCALGAAIYGAAAIAGTIGYEILTSLGPRYTRRYTEARG